MKTIEKIIVKIADLCGYLSGWLIPLMVILVAYEVFMRYVMHNPPMVADEFSAYMLVALSYLGIAYTWKEGGHIRITILVRRLPFMVANWIRLFVLIINLAFLIGITHASYNMIVYALKINLRSETWLTFPLFWPQLTIFIGFIILFCTISIEIVNVVKSILNRTSVEGELQ